MTRCLRPLFISVQGPESTKLCVSQCLLKDVLRGFALPRHRHASTTGLITSQASDPVFQATTFSVRLHTCCLCCDIVVQRIVGKDILQVTWSLRKNKWMACFSDLRTMESSPFYTFACIKVNQERPSCFKLSSFYFFGYAFIFCFCCSLHCSCSHKYTSYLFIYFYYCMPTSKSVCFIMHLFQGVLCCLSTLESDLLLFPGQQ